MGDGRAREGALRPPVGEEALRQTLRGYELFRSGRTTASEAAFSEAVRADSGNTTAQLNLLLPLALRDWRARDSLVRVLEAQRAALLPGESQLLDWFSAAFHESPEAEYRASESATGVSQAMALLQMYSANRALRPRDALRIYEASDTALVADGHWQVLHQEAARAYHSLGEHEAELALARAARKREPRAFVNWMAEAVALAALDRPASIDSLLVAASALENPNAANQLLFNVILEYERHHPERAAPWAERSLAQLRLVPDSIGVRNVTYTNARRTAFRALGQPDSVLAWYRLSADSRGPRATEWALLSSRFRVLAGDTTGVARLVERARTFTLDSTESWSVHGSSQYYAAQLLALTNRREESVQLLRAAMNSGVRLGPDERLQWFWAPLRGYAPFEELVRVRATP